MIAPPTLRTALTTWLDLARSRKGFRFDNSRGEFIYNANGRTVPLSKLEKEGKGYRDFTNENMQYQTERMLDGRISLPDWQRRMVREIRDSWRTEYILGRGGIDQMTQADWGRIGGRLQFQYRQLDRFADRILLGDMTPAQIRANAKLYANASVTGLYDGRTTAKVQAGYIGESRHLRPGESCNSCIGYEAQGIVIIGTLPEPGQQSECYTNCNCFKKYYRELPGTPAPIGFDSEDGARNWIAQNLLEPIPDYVPSDKIDQFLKERIKIEGIPLDVVEEFAQTFLKMADKHNLPRLTRVSNKTVLSGSVAEFAHNRDRTRLELNISKSFIDGLEKNGISLSDWTKRMSLNRALTGNGTISELAYHEAVHYYHRTNPQIDSGVNRLFEIAKDKGWDGISSLSEKNQAEFFAELMVSIEDVGIDAWANLDDEFGSIIRSIAP